MKHKRLLSAIAMCILLTMLIGACSPQASSPAVPAGTTAAVSQAPASQAPAEPAQPAAAGEGEIYTGPRLAAGPNGAFPSIEEVNRANNLPIVDPPGSLTFTIYQRLTNTVTSLDMGVNKFTDILVAATGINLEFITSPQADDVTKRNLLLSSGDYPEIMSMRGFGLNQMSLYAAQGIFVPLDEHIEKWGVNTKAVFADYPDSKVLVTHTDGQIYSLPDVNDCYHCLRGESRNWYYRPWIEQLNDGKIPQTTAEFKEYLIKIRDGDPNGNGAKDEIPLTWRKTNIWKAINWAANSFQPFPHKGWALINDKITPLYTNEEFKQTLLWLNELYSEGLILQESFSIENNDLIAIGEDPGGATLGNIIGWGPEDGTKKAGETNRWYEYFVMSPLEGPTGQRNTIYNTYYIFSNGWFVTDKCSNVEAAVRLGDLLLDEYYGYSSYIGPEGLSWTYAEPGEIGLDGQPAVFKELVTYGAQEENCSWDQTNITYRGEKFRLSQTAEGADDVYKFLDGVCDPALRDQMATLGSYNEIMKYYGSHKALTPYAIDPDLTVPPLLYDDAHAAEIADIEAVIDPFLEEKFASFVTGLEDIESGFDKFISDLNQMGLERLITAKQAAYDAQFK